MKLIALLNEMEQQNDSWNILDALAYRSHIPVLRVTHLISALFEG